MLPCKTVCSCGAVYESNLHYSVSGMQPFTYCPFCGEESSDEWCQYFSCPKCSKLIYINIDELKEGHKCPCCSEEIFDEISDDLAGDEKYCWTNNLKPVVCPKCGAEDQYNIESEYEEQFYCNECEEWHNVPYDNWGIGEIFKCNTCSKEIITNEDNTRAVCETIMCKSCNHKWNAAQYWTDFFNGI